MDFKDKQLPSPKIDANGRRTTEYVLEILPTDKKEDSLIHDAMANLALNLMSDSSIGVGPIKANILLRYLEDHDKNPSRITLSYEDAEHFASLLRLSSNTTLGQVAGEQAIEIANEIKEEALTRPFRRQLDLNTIEDLLQ